MSQEFDPLSGSEINLKEHLDVIRLRKAMFIQVFVDRKSVV